MNVLVCMITFRAMYIYEMHKTFVDFVICIMLRLMCDLFISILRVLAVEELSNLIVQWL